MENLPAFLAEEYALKTSESFFLTGKAGTGKTTLLRKIIHKSNKNIVVVAPTGVAAINAGGVTIHSMFTFPLKIFVPTFERVDLNVATNKALLKSHIRYRSEKRKIIQELDMLIIDEISMVRADLLDAIDYSLKYHRKNQKPFGGVQLVVIGDLFQLAPIAKDYEWSILRNHYSSPFFFNSHAWRQLNPIILELTKVYRQEEEHFIHILNEIRNGQVTQTVLQKLNERFDPHFDASESNSIILTTHNSKANDTNLRALNSLETRTHTFRADITGNFPESMYPAGEILTLKEGAQIMFIRNDAEDKAYFNGKLATIISIKDVDIKVEFHDDGREYFLKKEKWENKVYTLNKETNEVEQDVLGSFEQYPIRLAWAITIHKSQGLTFTSAVIDVANAFASGQTYVALSRCTNLEGMVLKSKVNERAIHINSEIRKYYKDLDSASEIEGLLGGAKKKYAKSLVKKTFNLAYLKDDCGDWIKVLDKKNIPDKEKVENLSKEIQQEIEHLIQVGNKFLRQLDILFYEDEQKVQKIKERIEKAIAFFSERLFCNLITPMHEHLNEYAFKKGVKTYLRQAEEFQKNLWVLLHRLYNVELNEELIWRRTRHNLQELPKATKPEKKKKKVDTYTMTLQLYKEGKSIKEIADIRSMAITTIEGHLAKWIGKGEVDISDLVKGSRLNKILPYLDNMKDEKLTTLKKSIPLETTFSELKYIKAYYEFEMDKVKAESD